MKNLKFLAMLLFAALASSAWAAEITIEAYGQAISDSTTWTDCTVNITGSGTVTYSKRIVISGSVTINLGVGTTLVASSGIEVDEGNELTIEGDGALNAIVADNFYAAIGRGFHGNTPGTSGIININGGIITATGGKFAAGIGGGDTGAGGTININGGTIVATGGYLAAGIGGGVYGAGGVINISGGQVTAISDDRASGIGPGYKGGISGTVTLGWTNNDDFIYATNYDNVEKLTLDDEFYFVDNGEHVIATTANINGKTLTPLTDQNQIRKEFISGIEQEYVYSDEIIKIPYVVENMLGRTLVEGVDYTVALKRWSCDETWKDTTVVAYTGDYYLEFTGMGNYEGTAKIPFSVIPHVIGVYAVVTIEEDQDGKHAIIDGESKDRRTVEIDDNIDVKDVKFSRTFTIGKYSTIVLPFDILPEMVNGANFYKIDSVRKENGVWKTVRISKVDGKIVANTPYLLRPSAKTLSFNGPLILNTSVKRPYEFEKDGVKWEFRGTYHYFDFANDSTHLIGTTYGFAAKDQADGLKVGDFRWTSDKSYILPMRAYLVCNEVDGNKASKNKPQVRFAPRMSATLPESLEVEIVDEDGGTTVIGMLDSRTGEIRLNSRSAGRWFDLQGRVLNGKPVVKGKYLHNGKVEVIK